MTQFRRIPRRALLSGALAGALLATAACTPDDTDNGASDGTGSTATTIDINPDDINLTAGLETYANCPALLERLKAEGLERVGPYGLGGGGFWPRPFEAEGLRAGDGNGGDAPAMADGGGSDSGSAVGGGFPTDASASTTNNQEAGVDEADMVKTDGNRLVIAAGSTLRVIDLATNEVTHQIELGEQFYGGELFLIGDRVLLVTQGWVDDSAAMADARISLPVGVQITRITEVDLTTGDTPRTFQFEGGYLSGREIDGTVRFVVWSGIGNLPFLFPATPNAAEQAEAHNRRVIEESTIEQWLPTYRMTENGTEVDSGTLVACERMFVPGEFSGFGALTVLTIDGEHGLRPTDAMAVMSEGQTVYASPDRLAVATARWPEISPEGELVEDTAYVTQLHSFDITNPDRTEYVASGSVEGHLLGQYSLSEHDGYWRVATTAGNPWWGGGEPSESFITVLGESGGALQTVGKVGGMGLDEQIMAVRFMGSVAYIVTFRQVDPLYAVDLSDPARPTVLGELKIPGFSAYLHPVADGLLLGVGQDATDDGMTTGTQVSLFDVSNPTDPQRIGQLDLAGDGYDSVSSRVEWDPRAFTWWDPTNTAYIPVASYRWSDGTNTTASVAVSVENGSLVELARIEHPATEQCEEWIIYEDTPTPAGEPGEDNGEATPTLTEHCWTWSPEIARTVIANDRVYTVSDGGVMVSNLADHAPIQWLPF